MDPIILDKIPFLIDEDDLLKRLHVDAGCSDAVVAQRLAAEAAAVARPRGLYGPAYVESRDEDSVVIEGITFRSRVLRVNLEGTYRVFPYVATCGTELDEWSNGLRDVMERFWADTIKLMALGAATAALSRHLKERYRPGKTADMNPGSLADWPLSEQRALFAVLADPAKSIGVELTDSFLLVPIKSVSGIRFPTEVDFASCQLCPRKGCPGRRAPYDENLLRTKYARQDATQ